MWYVQSMEICNSSQHLERVQFDKYFWKGLFLLIMISDRVTWCLKYRISLERFSFTKSITMLRYTSSLFLPLLKKYLIIWTQLSCSNSFNISNSLFLYLGSWNTLFTATGSPENLSVAYYCWFYQYLVNWSKSAFAYYFIYLEIIWLLITISVYITFFGILIHWSKKYLYFISYLI